jgi:hypothetical protein
LKKGPIVLSVLDVVTATLPTLLATAAGALFAMMAWASHSTH